MHNMQGVNTEATAVSVGQKFIHFGIITHIKVQALALIALFLIFNLLLAEFQNL